MSEEVKGFIDKVKLYGIGYSKQFSYHYLIFSSRRLIAAKVGTDYSAVGLPFGLAGFFVGKALSKEKDKNLDSILTSLVERGGDSKNALNGILGVSKDNFEVPYSDVKKRLRLRESWEDGKLL